MYFGVQDKNRSCAEILVKLFSMQAEHLLTMLEIKRKEKKNEIWLGPMTKGPLPTKNSTTNRQNKNATKSFDNTTTSDRLRTVSWVTTAIQLVLLKRFTGTQPSH